MGKERIPYGSDFQPVLPSSLVCLSPAIPQLATEGQHRNLFGWCPGISCAILKSPASFQEEDLWVRVSVVGEGICFNLIPLGARQTPSSDGKTARQPSGSAWRSFHFV